MNKTVITPEEIKTEEQGDGKVLVDKITLANILERLAAVEDGKQGKRHVRNSLHTAKVRYAGPNEDELLLAMEKVMRRQSLAAANIL